MTTPSSTPPPQPAPEAPAPASPSSARDFDRELKELEVLNKQQELDARKQEASEKSHWLVRWNNPAVLAILAALIGYLGTLINWSFARSDERDRHNDTLELEAAKQRASEQLEQKKLQGTLILNAMKTGEGTDQAKRAAANLLLLADAKILAFDAETLTRLKERAGDVGFGLPSSADIEFRQSPSLTQELQAKLQRELIGYQQYLVGIGYDSGLARQSIPVLIDERSSDNAFFDGEVVHIGKALANDSEYALSALTWLLLKRSNPQAFSALDDSHGVHLSGFVQALKFYLTCSYRNDPQFGKNFWMLTGIATPPGNDPRFLFNLKTARKWDQTGGVKEMEEHRLGEIWGASLWELREQLGQQIADKLVFTTWKQFKPVKSELNRPKFYIDAIIAAAVTIDASLDQKLVRQVFARRSLE
jgi:hypothetical protein